MILYFTGTGNSKYIAERIATALNDRLLNMNERIKAKNTEEVKSRETCLGIRLYVLYGMYLRLPGRDDRIWKEERRETTLYI